MSVRDQGLKFLLKFMAIMTKEEGRRADEVEKGFQ
jgi:hypothetical protein